MNLSDFQEWIRDFYSQRGWAELGAFPRVGFLMEEAGEVARAVRAHEIGRDRPDEGQKSQVELKQDIVEELGDVFGNIVVLANIYGIGLDEIAHAHKNKLLDRYKDK